VEALQKGVVGAGLLVSISDRGFFDTFKEAGALAKHVAGATERLERAARTSTRTAAGLAEASPDKVERETEAATAKATLSRRRPMSWSCTVTSSSRSPSPLWLPRLREIGERA
jgi:hypothetical protein